MKKYLKKSLSVFMAFLMVLSCFVFAPEMFTFEADAAQQGQYYVKIYWTSLNGCNDLTNSYGGFDTGGSKCAGISVKFADDSVQNRDLGKNGTKELYNASDDDAEDFVWELPGCSSFPTIVYATLAAKWNNKGQMQITKVEIAPNEDRSNITTLWTGTAILTSSGNTKKLKFGLDDYAWSSSSDDENNDVTRDESANGKWTSPTPTTVTIDGDAELTVPGGHNASDGNSKTGFATTCVYDQYGVTLNKNVTGFEFYTADNRDNAAVSLADLKVTSVVNSGATDTANISVSNTTAIKNWIATGSTATIADDAEVSSSRKLWVFAKYDNIYSKTGAKVTLTNPTYTWTFNANGGEFSTGETTETADELYYGQAIGSKMPNKATREAYFFGEENYDEATDTYSYKPAYKGSDGKPYYVENAAKTRATSDLTLDAVWTPYRNTLEFYNYDGQLLGKIDGRYDDGLMSKHKDSYNAIANKATKPGDSAASSYTFDKFVNWDTGEELNENNYVLKNTENNGVTRFIARFKVSETKTYSYKFYSNGNSIVGYSKDGLAYRKEIEFPTAQTKADNGDYQYEFAGWIAEADDGKTPADLIVNNLENEENVDIEGALKEGQTYIAPDENGKFHYYLKKNLKLYPVYIATYRNVTIKLYHRDNDGEFVTSPTTIKGSRPENSTQIGKTYNLGVPTPLSYNKSVIEGGDRHIKSYTFIGWSTEECRAGEGEPKYPLIDGSTVINAELKGDLTLYAVYRESDVNFTAYYYNEGELFGSDTSVELDKSFTPTMKDADGNDPTKPRDGKKGYEFLGWSLQAPGEGEQEVFEGTYTIDNSNLSNPIFYAVYKEFTYYSVTFVDESGNPVEDENGKPLSYTDEEGVTHYYSRDDYKQDDKVVAPTLPDKDSTVKNTNKFVAWCDVETQMCYEIEKIPAVEKDVVYRPVYETKLRQYTVTFKNIGVKNDEGETVNDVLTTVTLDYGTNIYEWIEENIDKKIGEGEDAKTLRQLIEAKIPESNSSYAYSFDWTENWTPRINKETTVTGDCDYTATYKTATVLYPVNWLTTSKDSEGNTTVKNYLTTNYTYNSNISIPSQRPTAEDPKDKDHPETQFTWGFLGWYECDENGKIKTDESGAEVKFVKGTKAVNKEGVYYVAKFGYSAKAFDIKIYDSDKKTLLDTIPGNAFGSNVEINLSQYNNKLDKGNATDETTGEHINDSATKHYNVSSLTAMNGYEEGATPPSYTVDESYQITYTVGTTNELYITYEAVEHDFTAWQTTIPADYEKNGEEEHHCLDCGYQATQTINKYTDTVAPTGNISTGNNKWEGNLVEETAIAYVKRGALVSIIARDLGDATVHQRQTAGVGIKAIYYRWSDEIPESGTTGDLEALGWTKVEGTFTKYSTLNYNFNFILPEKDFENEDIYLEAKIIDFNDKECDIKTPILRIDETAPLLEIESECGKLEFGAADENELASVKVEKLTDGKFVALGADEYTVVIESQKDEGTEKTYSVAGGVVLLPDGTYQITVADKAGNETAQKVTVAADHNYTKDDGKTNYVTDKEPTCTEAGSKHAECLICGHEDVAVAIDAKGHDIKDVKFTVDVEATCEGKGSKSKHCKVCDAKCEITEIAAKGHDLEKTDYSKPTCEKDGYKIETCKNGCDYWKLITKAEDPTLAAKGHTLKETKTEEATCSKAGRTYNICSVCEAEYDVVEIPKKAHTYKQTEKGECVETTGEGENKVERFYTVSECTVCGDKVVANEDLKDHKYTSEYTDSTCTANGYTTYTCSVCEKSYKEEDRLTPLKEHVMVEVEKDYVAPTCENDGQRVYKCKTCEKTETEVIEALGHEWIKDDENSTEATCGKDGIFVEKCDREGCSVTKQTIIPATGTHNYTVEVEGSLVPATCEKAGSKKMKCNGCEETIEVEIPATGHAHAEGAEGTVITKATCKAEGERQYTCINGTDSHTYTEVIPVDPNAHDTKDAAAVKVNKKATCTEDGEEIRNCNICQSAVKVKVPALKHDFTTDTDQWKVTKEATCITNGEKTSVCLRCGETEMKEVEELDEATGETVKVKVPVTEVIKATGKHTLTKHDKVDPKCETAGTKEYYECTVCKKLFSDEKAEKAITAPETIEATGHNYEKDGDDYKYVEVEPTCSKDGYKYKVCTVCGKKTENEATDKKAFNHISDDAVHTLVKVNKKATCKDEGQGVYQCSLCGETFTKAIPVDPTAHSSSWTIVNATCTADGKKIETCSICNEKLNEVKIEKLGHAYKTTTRTEYKDGKIYTVISKTCSRCHYKPDDVWTEMGTACTVTFKTVENNVTTERGSITKEEGSMLKKSDLPSVDLTSIVAGKAKKIEWKVNGKVAEFPLKVEGNITVVGEITEYELTYTVKFVHTLAREELDSKEYKYGEKVVAPADLEVAGYTFSGWSATPSDPTTAVSKDNIPVATADVTYYAVFTAVEGATTYYVTFKNGTKTVAYEMVSKGTKINAPQYNPTKDANTTFHYTFKGWTDKDGALVTFPLTVDGNVTLYAKFDAQKHTECEKSTSKKNATCTQASEEIFECTVCGNVRTYYETPALGHDYKEVSRVDDGGKLTITYKCSRCPETWTKTVVYNASANIVVITVKDTAGNPVEGAKVQIYQGEFVTVTATTDSKGQAKFPKYDAETAPNGIKDGKYIVKVEKTGYNTASGELVVKDGTGAINLTFAKIDCHCICHSSNFFGKIRRLFNKFFRLFNKNYTCCSCGECEVIHS